MAFSSRVGLPGMIREKLAENPDRIDRMYRMKTFHPLTGVIL
jgi:hypothetical protein